MERVALLSFVFCLMYYLPSSAMALEVAEGGISTQVIDRQPVDAVQRYPAASGQLFCFTRITGAVGDVRIFHVWYREDQEMARVELPVKTSNWRTWSSKRLLPEWEGSWRVEVLGEEGTLLQTFSFDLL